ncbi:MAG: hypothetical protein JO212_07770, partial [Acetobacteraceae bacterium]|nr:hypothetical protein [Acetobacteraceae bacterium]
MSQTGVDLRDVQAETITISGITLGFTAPEVQNLIKAAAAGAVGLADKISDLSQKLGVAYGAMRRMLADIGQADVPDERLVEKLAEVVAHSRKFHAAVAALDPENPVAQEHAAKASQAADSGDREQARYHLQASRAAAQAAAAEARRLAREAQAAAEKQMLQAARAAAAEAQLALTALDYLEAARLFEEAASLLPDGETRERGILLWGQADALQRHG